MARRPRRRRRSPAVSNIVAAVLLTGITVCAGVLLWTFRFTPSSPPPTIYYNARAGLSFPAWGDPTDCRPVLPYAGSYYLGNGSGDARWNTYMNAWWSQCESGNTGTYNNMNATGIVITQVSQPIPLSSIQFNFVCHNQTPTPMTTFLVRGSLQAMSWFPGSSQSIPSNAPKLGSCGTFNASGYHGGAFSVYYNRLGFFNPLTFGATLLKPGDTLVIYVHSLNAVLEAPSPIEPQSTWNHPDFDDFHGAPSWCFTDPNACSVILVDTAIKNQPVLATIPLLALHQ